MSTPRRSNAEIQFSEDEDETESASVIRHVVSLRIGEHPAEFSSSRHRNPKGLSDEYSCRIYSLKSSLSFLLSTLRALLGGGSVGCGFFVPFCLFEALSVFFQASVELTCSLTLACSQPSTPFFLRINVTCRNQ